MPGYRVHVGFGLFCVGAAIGSVVWLEWWHPSVEQMLLAGFIGLLGALFPDVDTDSKGQNLFYGILLVGDIYFIFVKNFKLAALIGLLAILPGLGRHRGWTHTWWAMLLVPFPLILLPYLIYGKVSLEFLIYYGFAVLGYLSHLVLDKKIF
ncbi:MAG: metal-dependent hydrolase [Desulfonauticus sp.]|nr:metal-dependent hydrolase [Desulfonauticus sp.]